jgi:hypothetical protein
MERRAKVQRDYHNKIPIRMMRNGINKTIMNAI